MTTQNQGNITYLFPGQGAQYVGMGYELYKNFEAAQRIFEEADHIVGFRLSKLCFEGPQEELTCTANSQPAIFTVSIACYEVLKREAPDLSPHAAAGLSLGEFTALVAADALSFPDGLRLVRHRGVFMQEACEAKAGTMASIIGLSEEDVVMICQDVAGQGIVDIANRNCPGQVVVSGEVETVKRVMEEAEKRGAQKAVQLNVSGAFHSRLMETARQRLAEVLEHTAIQPPCIPVVSNVTARAVATPDEIKKALTQQVVSSVLWEQSMIYLRDLGTEQCIEIGCGRVLRGLMKRIDSTVPVLNLEDRKGLEDIKKLFCKTP